MGDVSSDPTLKQKKKKKNKDPNASEALPTSVGDDESTKPKKKKQLEESDDQNKVESKKVKDAKKESDAQASEVADVEGKKQKKDKKNKFVLASSPVSSLPVAEDDERRRMQRDIQQLVIRLRAEGKTKQEIEIAKRDLKYGLGKSLRKPDGHRMKKIEAWKQKMATEDSTSGKKKLDEQKKEASERKHDIVVIPVIWRGRHDHQEILKAAEDVKACLSQQGLDVWVDSRRHYKPGQKFAHWEFRGVMIRVEIGPEDYTAGKLKVCRAKEAGDYKSVEKKELPMPPRGARRLLLTLKEWGLSKIDIEERAGDDDSDEDAPAATSKSKKRAAEEDDLGGNWEPRVLPAVAIVKDILVSW